MDKIIEDFKSEIAKIFTSLKKELGGVRTSRPSPLLVEDLKVNYYDQLQPLKALASIGIIPPHSIQIQAWDKGAVPSIVKAIENSSLNLTANVDSNIIRLNLPELSGERREELIKHIRRLAEDHRIQIRHERDGVNKKIERVFDEGEISEDGKFKFKEEIQKQIDKINDDIETMLSVKIEEISE